MIDTKVPVNIADTAENDALFSLSIQTVHITYDTLKHSVEKLVQDSKAVMDTVCAVSDMFNAIMGQSSMNVSQAVGGFGLIALPLPLAMKAMTSLLSKYVEQKTGFSLQSWTDFANSAKIQFEAYMAQISRVTDLSRQLHDVTASVKTEEQLQELQNCEQLLQDIKLKTNLWRPVMTQMSQLSQVVDSMLATSKDSEKNAKPVRVEEGWMHNLKHVNATVENALKGLTNESQQLLDQALGSLSGVKEQTERLRSQLLERILAPLSDVKERTEQLSYQISGLSTSLGELEDFLDLEIAQIQACLGKIPRQEVDILSKRVAASIVVPRLKKQLQDARQSVITCQAFLDKLNQMHEQARIKDKTYEILAAEYGAELHAAMARAETLKNEAGIWRDKEEAILDAGMHWLEDEIENVTARELVGQLAGNEARKRVAPLKREMNRFLEAKQFLITL